MRVRDRTEMKSGSGLPGRLQANNLTLELECERKNRVCQLISSHTKSNRVQDPTASDGGAYKCNASNELGESNANINLNFAGSPLLFVSKGMRNDEKCPQVAARINRLRRDQRLWGSRGLSPRTVAPSSSWSAESRAPPSPPQIGPRTAHRLCKDRCSPPYSSTRAIKPTYASWKSA